MTIDFYRMKSGQESRIAEIIREIALNFEARIYKSISAQNLIDNADLLRVEVAERDGKIIGFCAWVVTFSTWRGSRGAYIADHHVIEDTPDKESVSRELLRFACASAMKEGATFVRMEVDVSQDDNDVFFSEIGFWYEARLMLHYLEETKLRAFAGNARISGRNVPVDSTAA